MTGAGKPVLRIGLPSLARLARRENGTAAIELALLAPLLVLLLLNLVDFSLMIWSYMEADYSAQMGVRAAYATCAGVALPAMANCPGLNAAVATAIKGTSLGSRVTLAGGSPSEGYYCVSGTSLQQVGSYSAPPNPFNCAAAGNPNATPGDYIAVTVAYDFTPIFPGLSLASARTVTGSALQRLQ
jgi:Flp pilus assembly protein TadG